MRFHDYRKAQEKENPVLSALSILLGFIMVIVGSLLSIPPGVPGFLITVPGLGIIASRVKIVAILLDRSERILHDIWIKAKKKFSKN